MVSISIPRLRTSGLPGLWRQPQWHARLWELAIATLLLGLAYAPNFGELCTTWSEDQNYSHGFLVIPIALYILWQRLSERGPELSSAAIPASWLAWLLLAVILAIRAIAYEQSTQWTESATIVPAVACLTWMFGGWSLLRRVWPAIAFLVFMLPLPQPVNDLISLPLQRIATSGSCFLLQLSGLWSIQEGNVIHLKTPHGMEKLDVALACSGLRMLMMLAATVAATIILIPLATWKRIVLLLSAVPIALLTNMIRIVATGWCYYLGWNRQAAHDWSGYLMMPVGLLLVLLELSVLSWLVPVETESEEDQKPILATDQALELARQSARVKRGKQTTDKKKGDPMPEI
jgi:exosortase